MIKKEIGTRTENLKGKDDINYLVWAWCGGWVRKWEGGVEQERELLEKEGKIVRT